MGRKKTIDTGKRTLDIFILYLIYQFGRYLAEHAWHGGFSITWFDVLIFIVGGSLVLKVYAAKTK